MRKIFLLACLAMGTMASAQGEYTITVDSKKPSGIIDEMLYGHLQQLLMNCLKTILGISYIRKIRLNF